MITRVASMLTPLLLRDNLARSIVRSRTLAEIDRSRGDHEISTLRGAEIRCFLHFSEGNLHNFMQKERQTR